MKNYVLAGKKSSSNDAFGIAGNNGISTEILICRMLKKVKKAIEVYYMIVQK